MLGQILLDPTHGVFVFPIRNVGRGAARIQSLSATLSEGDATYSQYRALRVIRIEHSRSTAEPRT